MPVLIASMYYSKICIRPRTYYRYRRVRKRHDWHSRIKDHLAFRLRGNDLVLQRYHEMVWSYVSRAVRTGIVVSSKM